MRRAMIWCAALALLPDADVFTRRVFADPHGIAGHRGISHSLATAIVIGAIAGVTVRLGGMPPVRSALFSIALVATHGLLDTLTDGGAGIALLWPFSNERLHAPWRPIPVSPIGRGILSARGLYVMGVEAMIFAPLLAYALWPHRQRGASPGNER